MANDKKLLTGKRIKNMRTKRGITQTQLAHYTGYSDKSAISRIENGETVIPEVKIHLIAAALLTTVDYLLGKTDDPDTPESLIKSKTAGNANEAMIGILDEDRSQDIDFYLCVLRIKRFIENNLKLGSCTVEDAEAVTTLILEHIGAENLIPLAKLINSASPEIRRAALAVLNAAAEDGTQVNI